MAGGNILQARTDSSPGGQETIREIKPQDGRGEHGVLTAKEQ